MEYRILYSYWDKFHERKKRKVKDTFKEMDSYEKALFGGLFTSATIVAVPSLLWNMKVYETTIGVIMLFVAISLEIVSAVILYKCSMNKSIRKVKESISDLKKNFKEVHNWLKELGYIRNAEIKQFSVRCENILKELEKDKKENRKQIEKAISLFYIPTLLAIVSWILASNQEMHDIGFSQVKVGTIPIFSFTMYFFIFIYTLIV